MNEKEIVEAINFMCAESLSPDVFFQWEQVREELIKARKDLRE